MAIGDQMAARDTAERGLAIADKALAVVDEALASKQEMTGWTALLNEKVKGFHAEYMTLIDSLVGLHARLTEHGEDRIAEDLRSLWLASLDRLNSEVLVDPKDLH